MKTMVLFYPGCIEFEVMLACEILNSKYPVEVITPNGSDHVGSNGMTIKATRSLSAVNPSDYKVALFPGGDPSELIGNVQLNVVIQKLNIIGAILGAICAGPILLEQAGLLSNRRIAHGYKGAQLQCLLDQGHFKNTVLTDEATIIEENIVTARPDSFVDFAVEVAALSNAIESTKKSFWKEYYKGRPNGVI
jgi:putative intracellular protease/amidase